MFSIWPSFKLLNGVLFLICLLIILRAWFFKLGGFYNPLNLCFCHFVLFCSHFHSFVSLYFWTILCSISLINEKFILVKWITKERSSRERAALSRFQIQISSWWEIWSHLCIASAVKCAFAVVVNLSRKNLIFLRYFNRSCCFSHACGSVYWT